MPKFIGVNIFLHFDLLWTLLIMKQDISFLVNLISNSKMFFFRIKYQLAVQLQGEFLGDCEEELPKKTCWPTVSQLSADRLPTSYQQATDRLLRVKTRSKHNPETIIVPINTRS